MMSGDSTRRVVSFQPVAHPVGLGCYPVARGPQHLECFGHESIELRSGYHAQPGAAIGQRQGLARPRPRPVVCRWARSRGAGRHPVSGTERAPLETAHPGDEMRRTAPEHRRNRNTSSDGEIGPGPAAARTEPKPRTGSHGVRHAGRHLSLGGIDGEVGSRDRHDSLIVELELRPDQRHLERRGSVGIADQAIRKPVRVPVHRARDRDAKRLEPPSTAILHAGHDSGP